MRAIICVVSVLSFLGAASSASATPFNVAQGKSAYYGAPTAWSGPHPASAGVDGLSTSSIHNQLVGQAGASGATDGSFGTTWTVDLGGSFNLEHVEVWARAPFYDHGNGATLSLLAADETTVIASTTITGLSGMATTFTFDNGGGGFSNVAYVTLSGGTLQTFFGPEGAPNGYISISEVVAWGTPVPEPTAATLGLLGMLALSPLRRRRRR